MPSSGPCNSRRHFQLYSAVQGRRSAKIAGRKSSEDSKKSKSWGRIAKQVLQAVKADGPVLETNARLKEASSRARYFFVTQNVCP
jgi:transcriptional/translational regulatory protein YebC/TACO1